LRRHEQARSIATSDGWNAESFPWVRTFDVIVQGSTTRKDDWKSSQSAQTSGRIAEDRRDGGCARAAIDDVAATGYVFLPTRDSPGTSDYGAMSLAGDARVFLK
jgi:hypothetical protein